MKKALIISFEGPEGSGKTTVIEAVKRYLENRGCSYAVFREPGSTEIGERIREVILNTVHKKMDVYTELLLYLACRVQLIREKIRPALSRNRVVILDRFTDSTLVYQGFAGGIPLPWLRKIVKEFSLGVFPDRTFFLDVDARLGLTRSMRKDRMEQKSIRFHRKVRQGYAALARMYPSRIKRITSGEKEKMIADVIGHLQKLISS